MFCGCVAFLDVQPDNLVEKDLFKIILEYKKKL